MATVFERIRKVTVEQLGVKEEEVTPSSSFVDDLGADSLDLVELIMALEEEFTTAERKVTIPDEDAEKIATVQDAMDYLRDLGVSDHEVAKEAKPASKTGAVKPAAAPTAIKPATPASPRPANQPRQPRPGQPAKGTPPRPAPPPKPRPRSPETPKAP